MNNYCSTCLGYIASDPCDGCDGTEENHIYYEPDFVRKNMVFTECSTRLKKDSAVEVANVAERKKGKWKMEWHCFLHREIPMCSQCLRVSAFKYNFCPYCGADMREENSK